MISLRQADALLKDFHVPLPARRLPLEKAAGLVLQEVIRSDRPYPPVDRVCMDGIAVRHAVFQSGRRRFRILDIAKAGSPPKHLADDDGCIEVMTGSPCPGGADSVAPYEWLSMDGGYAEIAGDRVFRKGQNVQAAGTECPCSSLLLRPGVDLNPPRLAAAASVGHARVLVTPRPAVVILSTGDELVPARAEPDPWQLRESNAAGIECMLRGIAEVRRIAAGDDPRELGDAIARGLEESDILVLTGGVSAGKFDRVPEALRDAGVREVFHHAAIRPGKPLWFGAASDRRPVFGLPGNPVSCLICARRFVVPMAMAMAASPRNPNWRRVRLGVDAEKAEGVARFVPARLECNGRGSPVAYPVPMRGSGDFVGLLPSDGFLELQEGRSDFHAGGAARFVAWEIPGACHA